MVWFLCEFSDTGIEADRETTVRASHLLDHYSSLKNKSLFEKSESVFEKGYVGEKFLENLMTSPLK